MLSPAILRIMFRSFFQNVKSLFTRPIDEETLEKLEETMYEADLGSELIEELLKDVRPLLRSKKQVEAQKVLDAMRQKAKALLIETPPIEMGSPHVILMTGINGSGKTTTCAKLAKFYQSQGKSVLLAAADTFRAAAIEQLQLWAERLDVPIVKGQSGGDPAAVIFDAIQSAKSKNIDIVIADTAGRLQSKTDLMRELEKMRSVCHKSDPRSPHETLLVLDATTGQNGLDQAIKFHEFAPLTGIVLSKLDGSAKGGIALSIGQRLKLPVCYVGLGEGIDDFKVFDSNGYLDELFSLS